MKTTAIIVAAGSGSRFKSDTPKQFLEINGKSIIVHTLERFQSAPSVDAIILVLPAGRAETFDSKIVSKLKQVVPGGETRAHSVVNGLNAVGSKTEVVAVHDGARPLVTIDEIERTIAKARETGASCLVAPVTDTIKSIGGNEITATLDRSKLRRAVTPQVFRTEILKKAFESVDLNGSITDECYLVEKLGHPISIVEGNPYNIKITHQEDFIFATALLSEKEN